MQSAPEYPGLQMHSPGSLQYPPIDAVSHEIIIGRRSREIIKTDQKELVSMQIFFAENVLLQALTAWELFLFSIL